MKEQLLISIFFILLAFFVSCNDDINEIEENLNIEECEDIANIGEILMLESSKDFLPYSDTISKIIFTNSDGDEFIGNIIQDSTFIGSGFTIGTSPCPIDQDVNIQYRWMSEIRDVRIHIETVDIQIMLRIGPVIWGNDYSQKLIADIFSFVLFTPIESSLPNSQVSIIINERNYPNPVSSFSDYQDEFSIHDKIFEEVYIKNPNPNEGFHLYYNTKFGIVGIKDSLNESIIDLKFERLE